MWGFIPSGPSRQNARAPLREVRFRSSWLNGYYIGCSGLNRHCSPHLVKHLHQILSIDSHTGSSFSINEIINRESEGSKCVQRSQDLATKHEFRYETPVSEAKLRLQSFLLTALPDSTAILGLSTIPTPAQEGLKSQETSILLSRLYVEAGSAFHVVSCTAPSQTLAPRNRLVKTPRVLWIGLLNFVKLDMAMVWRPVCVQFVVLGLLLDK
jgi:hypothetical protein